MAKNQPKQPKPGIVLYLRVSSDDRQNPENSFEYQRQRIMDAIDLGNNELPILNEYSDILSGTHSNRPDYQQMLEDARKGMFSHIAVYSIDRIGRSSDETLATVRELIELGIEILVSDSPNMELTTPSGALFLGIRAVIAQFEVEMMSQRVHDTKRSILLTGGWPSPVPDGYVRKWD
jgi:site-specific DNA recombinase